MNQSQPSATDEKSRKRLADKLQKDLCLRLDKNHTSQSKRKGTCFIRCWVRETGVDRFGVLPFAIDWMKIKRANHNPNVFFASVGRDASVPALDVGKWRETLQPITTENRAIWVLIATFSLHKVRRKDSSPQRKMDSFRRLFFYRSTFLLKELVHVIKRHSWFCTGVWSFSCYNDSKISRKHKEKHDGDWSRKYNRSWRADVTELDENMKSAEDFFIITL